MKNNFCSKSQLSLCFAYNFEVENTHNYFVGSTQVLVHNTCGGNGSATLSGQWKTVNESMSDFSRKYQTQITGREGQVWLQDCVKFDGMKDGILLDAKGKYAQFVNKNTGRFYEWFTGKKGLN